MRMTKSTAVVAGLAAALLAFGPARAAADDAQGEPVMTALKTLRLSGYAQVLGVVWDKDIDSFTVRRARIALTGEIIKNLRFKIQVDAAKSPALLDGFVEYQPAAYAGVRTGQFLVPFSLESTTPTSDLDMVNRAPTVEALVPGRDNGASGRDIGAAAFGRFSIMEYTVGLLNGSGINKADTNSHKDFVGRAVLRPLGFLSVGGSLYLGKQNPAEPGVLLRRNKTGLEAAVVISRFSVKGEYIHSTDDVISRAGWYVQAGGFAVAKKLQLLFRYDSLDMDRSVAGDGKRTIAAGFNWFIFGKTKLQVNYETHRLQSGGSEKSGVLAQLQAGF